MWLSGDPDLPFFLIKKINPIVKPRLISTSEEEGWGVQLIARTILVMLCFERDEIGA